MTSTIPLINPTTGIAPTFPNIKSTRIVSTTINIFSKCNYYTIDNHCIFANLTNEQILIKLKQDIISTYPFDGKCVIVNGSNSFSFQVTNTFNERNIINTEKEAFSINLGTCEQTLKDAYNITNELSLIILKYFKGEYSPNEKAIQYELYHPITYEKLNLSFCKNDTLEVNIQINLEQNFINLFEKAKEQGYNLLDPDDPFYSKICTRYTSENGTDVLLDDRVSFYFNKVANLTTCPENCRFISYSPEDQNLKCECGVIEADINTIDVNNIIGSNTYQSFYSTLKYSNYKVMRCYNLVFNFPIFRTNIGSILTLILFIIYIIFMIYYVYQGISPIRISISKIIFKKEKTDISNKNQGTKSEKRNKVGTSYSRKTLIYEEDKNKSVKYPPKKRKQSDLEVCKTDKNKNTEHFDLIDSSTKRKEDTNIKSYLKKKNMKASSKKYAKSNSVIEMQNNYKISKFKESKINKVTKDEDLMNDMIQTNKKLKTKKEEIISDYNDENMEAFGPEDYDNFELNNLDYLPACEVDQRSFFVTYWSVLLREHIGLMTFFSWNDHNLFYVKINRFIIQFTTNMAMNGLFFSDESMHYLYVNNGEYNFVQKIPQMLIALVIEHILEVILCYLSLTDTPYYAIKEITKNKINVENKIKIFKIIKCVKIKLIIFHIFTFLLFLFYWYFISAFCAVYKNTQVIFIRDSLTSYFTAMLDPFVIYALTTILRSISLCRCCRTKASFVYGVSQFLPLF